VIFRPWRSPSHDLHATILTLLGLDHKKLTYFFQGLNFDLADIHGDHHIARRLASG
jgi:Protein of unknown function (DUF1501)